MSIGELSGAPVPTVIGGTVRQARASVAGATVRVALLVGEPARSVQEWRDQPEFEVVLVAATWLELVHSPAFPADLVVLDAHLQEPVSIAARVRTCRAAGAQVVVLAGSDDELDRMQSTRAGAAGIVDAPASFAAVLAAARNAMGLTGDRLVQRSWWPAAAARPSRPSLSAGETIALRSYASGLSVKEVAVELGVRYETAKTYLRRVREKYARVGRDAGRRSDLIARATEDGYL